MKYKFTQEIVQDLQSKLNEHPIYHSINNLSSLQVFMEHHVYSVWDFMSLLKSLQELILYPRIPWTPHKAPTQVRLLREILLEEETDSLPNAPSTYLSHFEIYKLAMLEVGANTNTIEEFINSITQGSLDKALNSIDVPDASKKFINSTFQFINTKKTHVIASAFAIGREQIVPLMFKKLLKHSNYLHSAPLMTFYLNRHIQCDQEFHGPMSLTLLNEICQGDPIKYDEAIHAAQKSIQDRITLWDNVLSRIASI